MFIFSSSLWNQDRLFSLGGCIFAVSYYIPSTPLHTSLPPSFHSVKMTVFIACLILETSSFWDHRTWVPPLPYSLPGESPPFFIRTGLTLLKNPYCQYLEGFPVLKLNSYSLWIIRYFWNLVTLHDMMPAYFFGERSVNLKSIFFWNPIAQKPNEILDKILP